MKRLLAALLSLAVCFFALPPAASAADAAALGDINADGEVDIFDAMDLYMYSDGSAVLSDDALTVADCNEDSSVDIFDAMDLYMVAAGYGDDDNNDSIIGTPWEPSIRDGITDETAYMQNFCVYNSATGKTFTAATKEDLQMAVATLVRYEMGMSTFGMNNDEAWKAMAVAAYTHVARQCFNGGTYTIYMPKDVDLNDETDKRIYDAAGAVLGIKVAYNDASLSAFDQLCQVFYSASSAGVSCSTLTAWGYAHLPCNPVVESPYDNENWINICSGGTDTLTHTFTISTEDLYERLASYFDEDVIYCDEKEGEFSLYATQADGPYWATSNLYYINSEGNRRYIRGVELYAVIPGCKSPAITVLSEEDGVLTMQSKGHGHGIGMSQYGAAGYANVAGWTYDMILAHYYGFSEDTAWGLVGPKW